MRLPNTESKAETLSSICETRNVSLKASTESPTTQFTNIGQETSVDLGRNENLEAPMEQLVYLNYLRLLSHIVHV